MTSEKFFDKEYFESSSYARQEFEIITRNYKNLLDKGLKYFPEINNQKKIKILDFGCAFGIGTNYLSNRFSDGLIVGIDISDYSIQKAKKLFGDRKNLMFHRLDLSNETSLSLLINKYGYFDMIFTRDVLEHIPKNKQETIIKHFSFLLKRNGVVLASIANKLNFYSYICDKTHIGLRSPWFWKKVFNRNMEVIDCFEKQWIPFLWRLAKNKEIIEVKMPLFGFVIYLFAKKRG